MCIVLFELSLNLVSHLFKKLFALFFQKMLFKEEKSRLRLIYNFNKRNFIELVLKYILSLKLKKLK